MISLNYIEAGEPRDTIASEIRAVSKVMGSMFKTTQIEDTVINLCNLFGVSYFDLKSRSRVSELVQVRMIAMYNLLDQGHTLKEIGEIFDRDHTTVIHARDTIYECTEKTNKALWLKLKIAGIVIIPNPITYAQKLEAKNK